MKTKRPGPTAVPQPPMKLLLGNLGELDSKAPIQSMMRLAREYGPIYKLTLAGKDVHVVSSQELVDELCDESRFVKRISGPLKHIRDFAGDGLFTAYNSEPNWAKAHRLLMPAFGPIGVRSMFDRMVDIADQMFVKWERFGPSGVIDVVDNMTRLTLDTIALCAFDVRFNSFYQNEMHPFVAAMTGALEEARDARPATEHGLEASWSRSKRRYEADQKLLAHKSADTVRRRAPGRPQGPREEGPAQRHDERGRPGHRREAVRREHPLPAGHLPDRRPRDHQRAAVVHLPVAGGELAA